VREIVNSFPLLVSYSLLNQARPTGTTALILVSLDPSTFEASLNLRQGYTTSSTGLVSLKSGKKVCATCFNEGKTQAERLERAVAEP